MHLFFSAILTSCLLFANFAFAERVSRAKAKALIGCSSQISLPNGSFIYKNSAPVRSSAPGAPIIGFRVEPTLIMLRNYGRGSVSVYGTNGTKIGACPWASAHEAAGGRARCSMNTRSLRAAAVRTGGSATGIFKIGNTCVRVPDLGRCYGSVKGLCNRLLS